MTLFLLFCLNTISDRPEANMCMLSRVPVSEFSFVERNQWFFAFEVQGHYDPLTLLYDSTALNPLIALIHNRTSAMLQLNAFVWCALTKSCSRTLAHLLRENVIFLNFTRISKF